MNKTRFWGIEVGDDGNDNQKMITKQIMMNWFGENFGKFEELSNIEYWMSWLNVKQLEFVTHLSLRSHYEPVMSDCSTDGCGLFVNPG